MASAEISHLVKMANDIAANLGFHEDAAVRIADHIQSFWTPRMRKLLLENAITDGNELSDELRPALKILKGG